MISEIITAIGGIGILAGIFAYVIHWSRRDERRKMQNDALNDQKARVTKGRERMLYGRELDLDERVRRNDGKW